MIFLKLRGLTFRVSRHILEHKSLAARSQTLFYLEWHCTVSLICLILPKGITLFFCICVWSHIKNFLRWNCDPTEKPRAWETEGLDVKLQWTERGSVLRIWLYILRNLTFKVSWYIYMKSKRKCHSFLFKMSFYLDL